MNTDKHRYECALFLICLLFVGTMGCVKEFEELDSKGLKQKLEQSHHDSASGWWYLGKKDFFHYLTLKYPTRQYYYKINDKYFEIVLDKPRKFSLDENQWLNLKTRHFKFKE